jgi:hypothetical protein
MSEKERAAFSDFVREHPFVAGGTAVISGGLSAYIAEDNGLSIPVAAGIGVAGAAAGVLLSSLLYLERPAYVKDHPYIAGFQFIGVTGVTAFFISELTGGLISIPVALLLGAPAGIGAVALTSVGYEWLSGLLSPFKNAAEIGKDIVAGAGATLESIPDGPRVIGEAIASGEIARDIEDDVKSAFDISGSKINVDQVKKNGTLEERLLCDQIIALMAKQLVGRLSNDERTRLAQMMLALRKMLDDNHQDNWGRSLASNDDADFTTNAANPPPPTDDEGTYYDAEEEEIRNDEIYQKEHPEAAEYSEIQRQQDVQDAMDRAKAGPFAVGAFGK